MDATIISATLDTKELQASINEMVNKFDQGLQKMLDHTNSKVTEINNALKQISNATFDSKGSKDGVVGNTSKQVQKQDEVTKAVERTIAAKKEEKATYDQVAQAQQIATRKPSTAEESYQTFVKNMRENVTLLAMEIKKMPEWTLSKQIQAHEQYERQIEKSKQRIAELKQQMAELGKEPSNNRLAMQQTMEQISAEQQKINTLQKEQILEVQRLSNANKQELAEKQAQYELERKRLVEMSAGENERAKFARNNTEEAQKYTEEIQKQAKAIRESEQWKKEGRYLSGNDVYYDKDRTNATKREKEQMLTLEEQILQKMNLREESEKRIAQASRETNAALEQRSKSGAELGWKTVQEMQMASNAGGFSTQAKEIDYLRQQIAAILDVREQDVQKTNLQMATYNKLSAYLKQLQTAYQSLSADNLKREGSDIANEIQRVTRAMQQFQAQMNRPTRAYVFGLDENTLDDIAHKMQMLQRYRSGLNVDTQRNEINQVNQAYDRLKAKMDEVMAKSVQMNTINNALTRSFNYMKNRLAFYFTVGASTSFVKSLIEIRSQYEMNERALGILIDSAEKGTQVFKELSSMALVSPYTLIELSNAAKQLTAYGVAARDVVDTTRRLADISAAVGAPVERIAYALGHVQSYGYLTSLQARQFANSGIPLVKELAERYSELEGRVVSTADVYDRMKKKQVEYADVLDVVNRMTDEGGRFFDFQAKMADTLKVQLSNLNLAYNNMLNDMGKESQGVIVGAIKGLKQLFLAWKSIDKAIYDVLWTLGSAKLLQAIRIASIGLGAFGKQMTWNILVGKKLSSVIFSLASSFKALVLSPATWVAALSFAAVSATRDLMNLNEAQKEFNKSLREAGENNSKSLSDFLSQYDGGKKAIKKEDAEKVWGEMREQIELTVKKSDEFVGSLLKISDVSERLRKGFELINDINEVNAALKDLDDEAIKIDTDYSKWWNANILPDGLIDEIEKYTDAQRKLNDLRMTGESLSEMNDATEKLEEKFYSLERSVSATTLSILDLIELKGWSGNVNKINAVFDQVLGKISEDNGLSPQQAFNLQMAAEKARGQAVEKALGIRIDDERAALKLATDEVTRYEILKRKDALEQELRFFQQNTSTQRVYWRDFTNWIKTQHIAETQAMFRGMDAQQIKALDFQKGQYFDWIDKLTKQYAKEHNKTYLETFDMLKNYITNANQMSIFIPLVIGTDKKKSLYEELTGADSDIDAANKKIERLTQRRNELLQKGGRYSNDRKVVDDTIRAEKELAQAQEDFNDALKKGGHIKDKNRNDSKKDPVLDSLKDEISLVKKLQSEYDKLTKKGATQSEALESITSAYGHTLDLLNKDLQSFGLPKLDLSIITGKNPHDVLKFFENLRDALNDKGLSNLDRMKAVEGVIEEFNVSVKEYNLDKVAKGLNNELGKLKDEYELAVELDANPELGGIFADMMGLSKEEIESLPRDFEGVVRKMQSIMDDQLGVGRFDVRSNLNKKMFEQWLNTNNIDLESSLGQRLNAFVEQGNKIRQDEANKQVEEWNKLLEKYATYEYKKLQIQKEYEKEMEEARKNGADADITRAIENQRKERLGQLELEEFQKTPDWIVATGDLAGLSNQALQMLIDSINEFKRTARDLTPKQIKQINEALKKLRNEQRKDNPLSKLSILFDEVSSKVSVYQEDIDQLQEKYDKLNEKQKEGENLTEAEREEYANLGAQIQDLKEKLKDVKKVSAVDIVDALNSIEKTATQAGGAIAEMIEAFGDKEGADALKNIMSAFDKAADWAKMGAAIAGPWGAAIGAVAGLVTGMVSFLAESISGNAKITKQVEASERNLKRLESTFKSLESAASNAYGAVVEGLQRATVESKKLQLAEIQRQLQLEQSRKEKYKDEDKIIDLQSKVRDLRREIEEGSQDIINNLLNISSAGDGVTQLVQTMIDAFRNGEDAMEAFGNKWGEMIDNMILKLIVTEYMQRGWDKLMENLNKMEDEFLGKISQDKAQAQSVLESMEGLTKEEQKKAMADFLGIQSLVGAQNVISDEALEMWINALKQQLEAAENSIYDASVEFDKWALEYMSTEGKSFMENWAKGVSDILPEYYTFGENNAGQLSNLQQGIQGITEDTASALEAYMNGVSQQVYLHSDLLTQIRDTLVSWDMDIQLATQAQILLQLQASYQVQMSIQSTLAGWSNASGQAVRVEMI